jgi:hypothetical protein
LVLERGELVIGEFGLAQHVGGKLQRRREIGPRALNVGRDEAGTLWSLASSS